MLLPSSESCPRIGGSVPLAVPSVLTPQSPSFCQQQILENYFLTGVLGPMLTPFSQAPRPAHQLKCVISGHPLPSLSQAPPSSNLALGSPCFLFLFFPRSDNDVLGSLLHTLFL